MVHDHAVSTASVPETYREAAAAEAYNQILRSYPAMAAATEHEFQHAHEVHSLIAKGRRLCQVLRPRFISPTRLAHLERVGSAIAGIFERAGSALFASDRLLDLIGADDQEREIWQVDPGYTDFTLTSRLDSFMVGNQLKFVEYNAETPAGIGYGDLLTDIFQTLPAFREWAKTQRFGEIRGLPRLLETLRWAHEARGSSEPPSVAVIDWEDVMTRRDFELCAEYFRLHGVPTVIVDPRRLAYRGGKLRCGNQEINLIYKRVLLHELLAKADEAADLLQAYRDGAVGMVNSPRCKMIHKKTTMALLSDPDSGLLHLDEIDRAIVDDTIPWTRLVRAGTTTYQEEPVDFESFVMDRRPQLVLKPSDDYGGSGVVLGWEVSDGQWSEALERAAGKNYVIQERVSVPQSEFPVFVNDELKIEPLLLDTCPLLFRGKLGSVLTRVSGAALLNVSAGTGSNTATLVLTDKEN